MENPTKPLPTVQAFLLGLQYVLAMYGATIVAGLFLVLVAGIFSSLRDFFPTRRHWFIDYRDWVKSNTDCSSELRRRHNNCEKFRFLSKLDYWTDHYHDYLNLDEIC